MKRDTPVPFTLRYRQEGKIKNENGFDSYKTLEERIKELKLSDYTLVCEEAN